jgi:hypothetical protein
LTNDGEGGVCASDGNDLADCFCGTGFQRDIFDAEALKAGDA